MDYTGVVKVRFLGGPQERMGMMHNTNKWKRGGALAP